MDETKDIVSSQGRQSLDEKIKLSPSYGQSFWRIHCLQLRKTLIPITRRNETVNTGPLFMIRWKSICRFSFIFELYYLQRILIYPYYRIIHWHQKSSFTSCFSFIISELLTMDFVQLLRCEALLVVEG